MQIQTKGLMDKNSTYTKVCTLTLLLLAGTLIPCIAQARESGDRPNIVVIFLDDSGYGGYPGVENATITDSKGNAVETRAGKNQIHFGTKAGETYTLVF